MMAIFLAAYQPKDPTLIAFTAGYKRGYIPGLPLCVDVAQESTALPLCACLFRLSVATFLLIIEY